MLQNLRNAFLAAFYLHTNNRLAQCRPPARSNSSDVFPHALDTNLSCVSKRTICKKKKIKLQHILSSFYISMGIAFDLNLAPMLHR